MTGNNTNINKYVDKKPVELVQELKDYKIKKSPLSVAARGKVVNKKSGSGYISENKGDYGPCKNSLCGCSCSSSTCDCSSIIGRVKGTGTGFSVSGRARDGNASGQVGSHFFSVKDDSGEARFLSGTAGGSAGTDGVNARLGVDLANVKSGGVQARVGVNVDTGVSTDDGSLGVKAAGFGVSVGKKMGVSTPFGEVKVDTDECVIQ